MPNGDHIPKTWSRLIVLVGAFRLRFGNWPTRLQLGSEARAELNDYLGQRRQSAFESKLRPTDLERGDPWYPIIASDDAGCVMDYEDVGDLDGTLELGERWLADIDPENDA